MYLSTIFCFSILYIVVFQFSAFCNAKLSFVYYL